MKHLFIVCIFSLAVTRLGETDNVSVTPNNLTNAQQETQKAIRSSYHNVITALKENYSSYNDLLQEIKDNLNFFTLSLFKTYGVVSEKYIQNTGLQSNTKTQPDSLTPDPLITDEQTSPYSKRHLKYNFQQKSIPHTHEFKNSIDVHKAHSTQLSKRSDLNLYDTFYCNGYGKYLENQTTYECPDGEYNPQEMDRYGKSICSSCKTNLCLNDCCDPIKNQTSYCFCASDRYGSSCEWAVNWNCVITPLSPYLPCSSLQVYPVPPDVLNDSNCTIFKPGDEVDFEVMLNCTSVWDIFSYRDATRPDLGYFPSYFIDNGEQLTLSSDPLLSLRSQIFNFYQLSDTSQVMISGALSFEQIQGLSVSTIQVQIPEDSRYAAGGRVYTETSLNSSNDDYADTLETNNWKTFLDLEFPNPIPTSSNHHFYAQNQFPVHLGAGGIAGIVVACTVVVISVLARYFRKRNRRSIK